MSIKKPNMTPAEFRRLKKSEKAMLVAHDVIQQIKLSNLNIRCGSYINPDSSILGLDELASAKANICQLGQACSVCAKGALFLTAIGRVNDATIGQVLHSGESAMVERMEKERIFSRSNLDLIECAFERDDVKGSLTVRQEEAAVTFGEDHYPSTKRLVAIMLNVLDHNGRFVPKDHISEARVNAALRVRVKST